MHTSYQLANILENPPPPMICISTKRTITSSTPCSVSSRRRSVTQTVLGLVVYSHGVRGGLVRPTNESSIVHAGLVSVLAIYGSLRRSYTGSSNGDTKLGNDKRTTTNRGDNGVIFYNNNNNNNSTGCGFLAFFRHRLRPRQLATGPSHLWNATRTCFCSLNG